MPTSPLIACTLTLDAFRDRERWISALNGRALRSQARVGRTLVLTYAAAAEDDVRELARRESACCAFLAIDVARLADVVRLRVTLPAEVTDPAHADTLLAPFLAGAAPRPGAAAAIVAVVACAACCALPLLGV